METREVGRDVAFCEVAIQGTEVLVVPDAQADPRFAENESVQGAPRIRFYAGAPLHSASGMNLGALSVIDTVPREFDANSQAMLKSLATLVVDELQLRYEIGERSRAARNLRILDAAIQQSSEAVMITTAKLAPPGPEIVFVNPAFTALTGMRAEEVVGKAARALQNLARDEAGLKEVRADLSAGREAEVDVHFFGAGGKEMLLRVHVSPVQAEGGKVTNFICYMHDATEERRAAAELQAAMEEANRANRAKSEFLSRMSHELRTPLHAILGFAQLLEIDSETRENQDNAAQIAVAGQHLLSLINEVLDLAQVQAGKFAYSPEPVDLCAAVEEMLSLVRPLAAEAGVRVETLKTTICEVQTSARRFKQVILNLLSNAVKYNHRGGSVSVSCEADDKRARITIADTGRGIAAQNLAKLFVPFERLDMAATDADGSGLGLALSKHLIEALGGCIGVESTLGQGSTFWVELPIRPSPSADSVDALPAEDPGEAPSRSLTPRAILYIEDNLSSLRLVERILARRPELTLISAMQGSIGLELAQQHQPALILLDVHLPDMRAEEVLRRLRSDPRTSAIPVAILSADATDAQIARLRDLGAVGYFTKPVDVRKFLALVDSSAPRLAGDPAAAGPAPVA